jgi:esterase
MKLFCKQYSEEGDPLIILHGLFGNQGNWGQHAKVFANALKVYGMDLRNHGRSEWEDAMSYELLAADVRDTMRLHSIDPANIVGHSMGGKTAMQLALTWPKLVRKLVIVDIAPAKYEPHHDDIFAGLKVLNLDLIESRQDANEIISDHISEKSIRDFLLANLVRDEGGTYSWRMNLDAIRKNYTSLIDNIPANAVFEGEVLFLKGGKSNYILKKHEKEIMKRFPNASITTVPNTGHWLHSEEPELFQSLVYKFLKN